MPDMNTSTDIESKIKLLPILGIAGGIISLWALGGGALYFFLPNWEGRGQFGDMFGAVTSLFTGLAFAGVIYTIFLQKQELYLQRKELELTRSQLSRSAQAQEASEKALGEQVEATLLAARLNALTSLIENLEHKIGTLRSEAEKTAVRNSRLEYIRLLEVEVELLDAGVSL